MYFCCDEVRRIGVKASSNLNGIDYLEVLDDPNQPVSDRQRTLFVNFLKPLSAGELTADNVSIDGGERITGIGILTATVDADGVLVVEVDRAGDFSIYRLVLITSPQDDTIPSGIDPMFAAIDFTFKAECPTDFDCQPERHCPIEPLAEPEINYLAKDYQSFRRLMLDRISTLVPDWHERHAADQGNMLVETLAYSADQCSYEQDAVATEAYLHTARKRISVRRHARLVDYFMHDGCNARTWVHVQAAANNVRVLRELMFNAQPLTTKLLTRVPGLSESVIAPDSPHLAQAWAAKPAVFELLDDVTLFQAHNEMTFYTWGDEECCLPAGATQATLADNAQDRLRLRVGDVLIFEEVLGPATGQPQDADRQHRQTVRLTEVSPEANLGIDGVTRTAGPVITDPLTNTPIVHIGWDIADALTFPLCISAVTSPEHGGNFVANISVARGNTVLADHGRTTTEDLATVPSPELFAPAADDSPCEHSQPTPIHPRFRPTLQHRDLTHAAPYDPGLAASSSMHWSMRDVMPEIALTGTLNAVQQPWQAQRDLVGSRHDHRHFVVEIERDRVAHLRFGDNEYAARPPVGTEFTAAYRYGNGTAGNIAMESLAHIVTDLTDIDGVRNPLAAAGGVEPETIEEVRHNAPVAFKTQERAVTMADYSAVTERQDDVQQAIASYRWTGSWHTVFLAADRFDGLPLDDEFEQTTRDFVERFRMAGHDLEVEPPTMVPLELEVFVCVEPAYYRSDVKEALLDVLSNQELPGGQRGLFHPDNLTFGQTVYLSPIYRALQRVAGVESVRVLTFQRFYSPDATPLSTGRIELGRSEIARLDNDPNFPEHGVLRLELGGGR